MAIIVNSRQLELNNSDIRTTTNAITIAAYNTVLDYTAIAEAITAAAVSLQPQKTLFRDTLINGRPLGDINNSGIVQTNDGLALLQWSTGGGTVDAKAYIEGTFIPYLLSNNNTYSQYFISGSVIPSNELAQFYKQLDQTVLPNSVILTAVLTNIELPATFTWSYATDLNPEVWNIIPNEISQNIFITNTTYMSWLGSAKSVIFKVEVSKIGYPSSTANKSVYYYQESDEVTSVSINNANVNVKCNTLGTVLSTSNTGATISASIDGKPIYYSDSIVPNTYYISATTIDPTNKVTLGTGAPVDANYVYSDITTLTESSVTATFSVVVRNRYGTDKPAKTVKQTFTKVVDEGFLDSTPPPTPTGVVLTAGFSSVFIAHDTPTYTVGKSHSQTIVYAVEVQSEQESKVFSNAANVAQFSGSRGTFNSGTSKGWRVWLKWRSKDGYESETPWGGTGGYYIKTTTIGNSDLGPLAVQAANLAQGAVEIGKIAQNAIEATNFATSIEPISISTDETLPTTKTTNTIYWSSNLYRWDGEKYTASVPTSNLTGTITSTQIGQNEVKSGNIASNSITTNKLLVVPVSLCPDPYFSDEVWWLGSGTDTNGWYFEVGSYLAVSKYAVLSSSATNPPGTARKHIWSNKVAAPAVGTDLRLRIRAKNGSNQAFYVTARFYSNSNTDLGDISITIPINSVEDDFFVRGKVPANADYIKFIIYNNGVTTFSGTCGVSAIALDVASSADLIVDGAVTAAKIQAGAVSADQIAANAITAKHLTLTDFTNLCSNGKGLSLDGWLNTGGISAVPDSATWWSAEYSSKSSIDIWTRDNYFGQPFLCKKDDEFYCEFLSTPFGGGTGNFAVRVGFRFKDKDGSDIDWIGITRSSGLSGERFVTGSIKAPANTATATVWLQIDKLGTNTSQANGDAFHITNIVLRRKNTANLIVDGAIEAVHLGVKSIAVGTAAIEDGAITNAMISDLTVENAKIASLDAAKITTGYLSADRIDAGTITAEKIDSKGLSIKDAAGNVIFSAGNATPVNSDSNSLRIIYPSGGILTAEGTVSGAIWIILPQAWTNTMMRFEVEVYEYVTESVQTYEVGGYNYEDTVWRNTYATYRGSPSRVRRVVFGKDTPTGRPMIAIGTFAGTWTHPKITIKNFVGTHRNFETNKWISGWSVSFQTSRQYAEQVAIETPTIGGAFSGLDQITQSNAGTYIAEAAIDSARIKDLNASKIIAGTITTDKLLVAGGLGPAINSDPNTQDSTAWGGGTFSIVLDSDSPTGQALSITSRGATTASRRFPLDTSKNYELRMTAKRVANSATTYLFMAFYNANDQVIDASSDSAGWPHGGTFHYFGLVNTLAPTSYTEYKVNFGPDETFKIPSGTKYGRIGVLGNYSGATADGNGNFICDQRFTNLRLVEKVGSDLIVNGAVTANKIYTGAVTTDKIQAGAITTNKLLVTGKGSALNDDPACMDLSAWTVENGTVITSAGAGGLAEGDQYFYVNGPVLNPNTGAAISGTDVRISSRKFPINAARTYSATAMLYVGSGNNRNMYITVRMFDGSGVELGHNGPNGAASAAGVTGWGGSFAGYTYGGLPTPGNWYRYGGLFGAGTDKPIPSNVKTAMITVWFHYSNGSGSVLQAAQAIRCEEAVGGDLIVDGAITASKIQAGAITTNKLLVTGKGAALNDDPACQDLTNWTFGAHGSTAVQVNISDSASGYYAFRSIYNSTTEAGSAASIDTVKSYPVTAGKKYLLSGWVRRSSNANGLLYLRLLDKNGGQLTNLGMEALTPTTSWKKYSGEFTPSNTAETSVQLRAILNWTGTAGYHEITDFRLEEKATSDSIASIGVNTVSSSVSGNKSTGGRVEIDAPVDGSNNSLGGRIRIYDGNNTLRLKIGYLG